MTGRIAVALCLAFGISEVRGQSVEWQLAPARAGKIAIGMTVDSLYAVYGRENTHLTDLYNEGMFTPALQLFVPSQPGAPVAIAQLREFCGFRVSSISAVSPLL